MSLSENFITSILAKPKTANTAIAKDIGIYNHTLHPNHTIDSTFKKSSTKPNCLAVSSTHIFAAQADKAVIHVYSRERSNQESLISFPERIHCIKLLNEGLLALGTAEGRIILWEVVSGRQVSTPTSHLQPVTCLTGDSDYVISGSEDSNILVWSVPALLSLALTGTAEPLRNLSNHRAGITTLAIGYSASGTNVLVSASKDNTAIVWNYHSGELLRTFLLSSTPFCLALDPCARAVYIGFEDSTIQLVDLFNPTSSQNSLFDPNQQATPISIKSEPLSGAPPTLEAVNCLGVSYDGTTLLSGHASGKIVQWETGPRKFSSELTDLNSPVTNLHMLSPFPETHKVRAINISKPKLGEGNHMLIAQLNGEIASGDEKEGLNAGFDDDVLEEAIMDFMMPVVVVGQQTDEQLRKENNELWAMVNEHNEQQKQTWSKFRKGPNGKVEG